MQAQWETGKVFELDAPEVGAADESQAKFLASFPYPYMNGMPGFEAKNIIIFITN